MTRKVHLTLALIIGLYAGDSSAQLFKLNFTPNGAFPPAALAGVQAEIDEIEADINKDLPGAGTPDRLMEGIAGSSVMAGKGIGSDYASNMEVFLIGGGVGVGADLEKNKEAKTDLSGAAAAVGVIVGTNLTWMDTQKILGLETNRLNVYMNFLTYDYEYDKKQTTADIALKSYGIHFSYDWIKGSGSKLLGWGGVKLHTGYEYNNMQVRATHRITESLNTTQGAETYSSSISAIPIANIDATSHSIPLEISSSVQLLYVLSLYGGLGLDYNVASAKGNGDLNSGDSDVNCTNGVCGGGMSVGTISAEANINGTGEADPFFFRGFAGVQINLPFIRIFGQVDKSFGNELIGGTAGVRFVY